MKIDGIDPLLLNRIKEQTDRMSVQRTESAVTENRVTRDGGYSRRETYPVSEEQNESKLKVAIERLNKNAEKENLPVRFQARRGSERWHIEVFDLASNEVIRDIPTEQAMSVVNRIQSLFGVLLDEKR
jgi:flagellar protein FlaG